ncbi:hypothetical protein [Mycolicibacterium conceptionense]|nr:hypothetical protein [Mycolicibacterium conceptionense]
MTMIVSVYAGFNALDSNESEASCAFADGTAAEDIVNWLMSEQADRIAEQRSDDPRAWLTNTVDLMLGNPPNTGADNGNFVIAYRRA